MDVFAHALRTYRQGEQSVEDLLATTIDIVAKGQATTTEVLATLTREDTKDPLPSEVVEGVKQGASTAKSRQIEHAELAESDDTVIDDELQEGSTSGSTAARSDSLISRYLASIPPSSCESPISSSDDYPLKGVGDVLNERFELVERIGSGNTSAVYKALDRYRSETNNLDQFVAIKVFKRTFQARPWLIALIRKAKKWQGVDLVHPNIVDEHGGFVYTYTKPRTSTILDLVHPNIVQVHGFGCDGPTVYLSMEYLSGESLARKIHSGRSQTMSVSEKLRMVNDMGEALSFAHERGIVHRDFKPSNVFITDTGQIKVLDFAIAQALSRAQLQKLDAPTPIYASAEMLEHREPDPRDDVYALACMTYEWLTDCHPFGRVRATQAREAGLQVQQAKDISRRQWKTLQKALAFDRNERTATVVQFLTGINTCARKRQYAISVAAATVVVGILSAVVYGTKVQPLSNAEFMWVESQMTAGPIPSTSRNPSTSLTASQPQGSDSVSPHVSQARVSAALRRSTDVTGWASPKQNANRQTRVPQPHTTVGDRPDPLQTGSVPDSFRNVAIATEPGHGGADPAAVGPEGAREVIERYQLDVLEGKEVVVDDTTCLMWEKSGSDAEINWTEAKRYVEALNSENYASYSDWRLPKMNELVSLLEPKIQKENRLYIDPLFDALQQTTWSADGTNGDIQFIDFYEGSLASKDQSDFNFVRAVRGSYCKKDAVNESS